MGTCGAYPSCRVLHVPCSRCRTLLIETSVHPSTPVTCSSSLLSTLLIPELSSSLFLTRPLSTLSHLPYTLLSSLYAHSLNPHSLHSERSFAQMAMSPCTLTPYTLYLTGYTLHRVNPPSSHSSHSPTFHRLPNSPTSAWINCPSWRSRIPDRRPNKTPSAPLRRGARSRWGRLLSGRLHVRAGRRTS